MSIRVNLLALEPQAHGYARLVIKGWKGASQQLEFTIQRNSDFHYLHEGQVWSNSPFWFQVPEFLATEDGKGLEVLVGPHIVDTLLEGSVNSAFSFVLNEPATGTKDDGVVLPDRGVTLRAAGDEKAAPPVYKGIILADVAGSIPAPAPAPAPAPVEEAPVVVAEPTPEPTPELTPEPEPVIEPTPEPVPAAPTPPSPPPVPAKKKAWLIPLLIALVVLTAIAVGAWLWLNKTPPPAPEPMPPTDSTGAACTLESMTSLPELAFVQACIKKSPGSAELLEIINVAKANNHCGVAQRLYANRAQAGDMQIAAAYAHEYDPKFHQASQCFAEPDKATAAYWYETILSHDPENAEAKERFEELKP